MAFIVKKGDVFTAAMFKSGSSSQGDWELVNIVDENGKNRTSIFASNIPCGVSEGATFVVEDIIAVKKINRQNKVTGTWEKDVSIEAVIKPCEAPQWIDNIEDDGTLPWELPL